MDRERARSVTYTVPARTLTGTTGQVAAQIDDLIATLVAFRCWVVEGSRRPERPSLGIVRGGCRAWTAVLVVASSVLLMGATRAAPQETAAWLAQERPGATAPGPTASTSEAAATAPSAPREAWRDVVFGLTLEGYFQASGSASPDRIVALRAYDTRVNSFSIQQVASVLELAPAVERGRRYGLRVDLQMGQATEALQGSAANEPRPDVYRHVWQAYGTFVAPLHRGLQVDFGKFGSNLGFETNYAKDNQAFSRAYLFNFLPYYHSGLRLTAPLDDHLTVIYMLTNGIQQTEDFNDFKSSHVSLVVKPAPAVTWTSSLFAGREQPDVEAGPGRDGVFSVLDSYITVNVTPAMLAGFDINRTSSAVSSDAEAKVLTGVAAYARWRVATATGLAFRYEHLDDQGLFGGVEQVLQEATVTLEQRLGEGLVVRAEYRGDWSDRPFFPSDSGLRRRQATWLLGAIWTVGSKTGPW